MTRRGLTLPVVTSFNEFVWIFAFALTLLCVQQAEALREIRARLGDTGPEAAGASAGQTHTQAATIHRELVGLRGQLKRVVLVVDRSNSMKAGERWSITRATIQTWLRRLSFEECALVMFNQTATLFPDDGSFLRVSGAGGDDNRLALSRRLDLIEPNGRTNTLEALRLAYAYPNVDTIILFTDGVPDQDGRGFDSRLVNQVYALARVHGTTVPINTVGLGQYFDQRFGEFLRRLPELTGGSFIGR